MRLGLKKKLAALYPGAAARRRQQKFEASVIDVLTQMNHHLQRLAHLGNGGHATYLGNNRVLTKCVVNDSVLGFMVAADDMLLAPWLIVSGLYEMDLTNFFAHRLKPDSRCVDVGANFGYFTCLMGRFSYYGKVVGIEPDETTYGLLRDNIYVNGLQDRASARHAAVSDAAGRLTLHRRVTRSGNTSIALPSEAMLQHLGEPLGDAFEVASMRLDDLLPEFDNRIDFVKIDVEGAEPLVLRGATQTIAANPQLNIVMEWSPGQISAAGFEVAGFLRELAAMGLKSADIGYTELRDIPLSELLNIDYRAGILLRREAG